MHTEPVSQAYAVLLHLIRSEKDDEKASQILRNSIADDLPASAARGAPRAARGDRAPARGHSPHRRWVPQPRLKA